MTRGVITFRVLTATLIGFSVFGLYQYPTNTSPNSPGEIGMGGEGEGKGTGEGGGEGKVEEKRQQWSALEICTYVRSGLQNNCLFAQINLAVTCSDLHTSLTTSNDGLQVDLMLRDLFGKLRQCIVC